MENIGLVLPFVLGILLRLGLPIGLTLLAAWGLRKLDQQWRKEASALIDQHAVPAIQVLRCWVAKGCPEERRNQCPVYLNNGVPCWQVFRDSEGRLADPCLDCDIFRKAGVPAHV